jgi:transketolase
MSGFDRNDVECFAQRIRNNIINTIVSNGDGHAGGALSSTDIIAVLFKAVMNLNGEDKEKRDKFLLSAGHKCLALYGALVETGVIDASVLKTYNKLNSPIPGHPDSSKLPGIDFSTGSLGHGLPLGCGYAIAAKILGNSYKTYVVMGDGEQGEGSNWEAASFAAHNKLDNLIAIIDENTLQINGRTDEVCKPTPFERRYDAFGWSTCNVNGHDVKELYDALSGAPIEKGKPTMIIARTIKGKGLSFLEDKAEYHHWNPDAEQGKRALAELSEKNKRWYK